MCKLFVKKNNTYSIVQLFIFEIFFLINSQSIYLGFEVWQFLTSMALTSTIAANIANNVNNNNNNNNDNNNLDNQSKYFLKTNLRFLIIKII